MDANEHKLHRENSGFISFSLGEIPDGTYYHGIDNTDSTKSWFLYFSIFSPIFDECFQDSNGHIADFLGESHYGNMENLRLIKGLLEKKLTILSSIKNLEEFIETTTKAFFFQVKSDIPNDLFINEFENRKIESWKEKWQLILSKLIEVNKGLIEIVDEAIKKEKVLWIFGI
jgi:hypothetical protein